MDDLGSEGVLGGRAEAVDVALDSVEQPGRGVGEITEQGAGGGGSVVAGEDLLKDVNRGAGGTRSRAG